MSAPKLLNPWHKFFLLCRYKVQEVVRVIQSIDEHYELGLVVVRIGGRSRRKRSFIIGHSISCNFQLIEPNNY